MEIPTEHILFKSENNLGISFKISTFFHGILFHFFYIYLRIETEQYHENCFLNDIFLSILYRHPFVRGLFCCIHLLCVVS